MPTRWDQDRSWIHRLPIHSIISMELESEFGAGFGVGQCQWGITYIEQSFWSCFLSKRSSIISIMIFFGIEKILNRFTFSSVYRLTCEARALMSPWLNNRLIMFLCLSVCICASDASIIGVYPALLGLSTSQASVSRSRPTISRLQWDTA